MIGKGKSSEKKKRCPHMCKCEVKSALRSLQRLYDERKKMLIDLRAYQSQLKTEFSVDPSSKVPKVQDCAHASRQDDMIRLVSNNDILNLQKQIVDHKICNLEENIELLKWLIEEIQKHRNLESKKRLAADTSYSSDDSEDDFDFEEQRKKATLQEIIQYVNYAFADQPISTPIVIPTSLSSASSGNNASNSNSGLIPLLSTMQINAVLEQDKNLLEPILLLKQACSVPKNRLLGKSSGHNASSSYTGLFPHLSVMRAPVDEIKSALKKKKILLRPSMKVQSADAAGPAKQKIRDDKAPCPNCKKLLPKSYLNRHVRNACKNASNLKTAPKTATDVGKNPNLMTPLTPKERQAMRPRVTAAHFAKPTTAIPLAASIKAANATNAANIFSSDNRRTSEPAQVALNSTVAPKYFITQEHLRRRTINPLQLLKENSQAHKNPQSKLNQNENQLLDLVRNSYHNLCKQLSETRAATNSTLGQNKCKCKCRIHGPRNSQNPLHVPASRREDTQPQFRNVHDEQLKMLNEQRTSKIHEMEELMAKLLHKITETEKKLLAMKDKIKFFKFSEKNQKDTEEKENQENEAGEETTDDGKIEEESSDDSTDSWDVLEVGEEGEKEMKGELNLGEIEEGEKNFMGMRESKSKSDLFQHVAKLQKAIEALNDSLIKGSLGNKTSSLGSQLKSTVNDMSAQVTQALNALQLDKTLPLSTIDVNQPGADTITTTTYDGNNEQNVEDVANRALLQEQFQYFLGTLMYG